MTELTPARARRMNDLSQSFCELPQLRNRLFTGREDLLEQLRSAFDGNGAAPGVVALVGMAGVGKTQLALEYAYRNASDYSFVGWVSAESEATIIEDLAKLAAPLGVEGAGAREKSAIAAAVIHELKHRARWLLVLDNAGDPETVTRFLPRVPQLRALITSRDREWGSIARQWVVPVWDDTESFEFVRQQIQDADPALVRELAVRLGNLPLAIAQATPIIGGRQTIASFLKQFSHDIEGVLSRGAARGNTATVWTTWSVSIAGITAECPGAAEFLALCSFFSSRPINCTDLSLAADVTPEPLRSALADTRAVERIKLALTRFSLAELERDTGALQLHDLFREVVRLQLSASERKIWLVTAIAVCDRLTRYDEFEPSTWSLSERVLPHALSVAAHAEKMAVNTPELVRTLGVACEFLSEHLSDFSRAHVALEQACRVERAVYGEDAAMPERLRISAQLLLRQGRFAESESLLRRAVELEQAGLPGSAAEVARSYSRLASALRLQGKHVEAKSAAQYAMELNQSVFGADDPRVASNLSELAYAAMAAGPSRTNEAEAFFLRAKATYEGHWGLEHPNVAILDLSLAGLLSESNRVRDAFALYRPAVKALESTLGAEHFLVASYLLVYGRALMASNHAQEAEAILQRATSLAEARFGDAPVLAGYLLNRAIARLLSAKLWGVLPDLRRARRLLEKADERERDGLLSSCEAVHRLTRTTQLSFVSIAIAAALALTQYCADEFPPIAAHASSLRRLFYDIGLGGIAMFSTWQVLFRFQRRPSGKYLPWLWVAFVCAAAFVHGVPESLTVFTLLWFYSEPIILKRVATQPEPALTTG